MKKEISLIIIISSALFLTNCVFVTGIAVRSSPAVVYANEPILFIIPGTYVYYDNNGDGDIFFYGGYWWRSWNGFWYRSDIYSGPWVEVDIVYVPYSVVHLPPRWRKIPSGTPRLKWREVRDRHQEWERERYWEKRHWRDRD